jgi:hypothetical protein
MNFGTLAACNSADQYINYVFDGNSYSINNVLGSVSVYGSIAQTSINGYDQAAGLNIYLSAAGVTVGTHALVDSSIGVNNTYANMGSTTGNVVFTTYGSTTGSYVEGTFSGGYTDQGSTAHTVSGSFRIKK